MRTAMLLAASSTVHAQVDPLPDSCTGSLTGVFTDGPAPKRVLSVVAPCGGAPNPNPKACAACTPDGKDWALTDASVSCPTKAGACPACDATKMTPLYCQQICTQMGEFRYSGVENGNQCFCANEISPKTAHPPADNKVPCAGDKTQMCGGPEVIAIYEVACKHAPAGAADSVDNEGSDWGSTFNILLILVALGYFVGGTFYNKRKTGSDSWSQSVPHPIFWANAIALVKDGVTFSQA